MHIYEVLRRPIVTEKNAGLMAGSKYAFEVAGEANKRQIKEAVEERDFTKVLAITKKPIFSFLENEIVRQLKQTAMSAS